MLPRKKQTEVETRRRNGEMAALASAFLNLAPDAVSINSVLEISSSCGVTPEYAYAESVAALFSLDTIGEDKDFFRSYFQEAFHLLSPEAYTSDPFYRLLAPALKGEGRARGKWRLRLQTLRAGEAFVCDDFLLTPDRRLIPQIGFFAQPYTYPALLEDGREWMTLLPNETTTTRAAIEAAHGRALTYGLGLGYFAYMAARKPEVESLTAVEISPDAIALFEEEIRPLIPPQISAKITVLRGDALDYAARTAPEEHFDFIFADIWHDAGDGRELYLKMKSLEPCTPTADHAYWLEDTLRLYLDPTLWPPPPA